jgi:hypothetical protein
LPKNTLELEDITIENQIISELSCVVFSCIFSLEQIKYFVFFLSRPIECNLGLGVTIVRNNGRYEHGVSDSDTLPLKLPDEDDYPDILEHPGFKRWRH